ncbi:Lnb N-terminal periplasmic domain-containing protein [Alteromonas sp. S015]|uniref:Lnb N-terminal periplasmic domain-containing protein n=1 Tax=Alteromonas sp. S015 TaxID=3117401 RepID=UPI002FE1BE80
MEGISRFLVVSILLLSHAFPIASAQSSVEAAALQPQWLSLLHYEKTFLGDYTSAIDTPAFFFSPRGSIDPLAELQATISSFVEKPDSQCTFPARAMFVSENVATLPDVQCDAFNAFISNINATGVSLVYASGYLGNPASMYGHVFLKFNNTSQSELLDNTYNYGARYPDNENPIAYILNGIFGGYNGYFANQKYHHQTLTYNESELRDLWEYSLSLTSKEISFLLAHLWELEQIPMTYYFFKQNCAYQIAQLLSLATSTSYMPNDKAWIMPFDIVAAIKKNHPSLISTVKYHPSRQEALYTKFAQLTEKEKAQLIVALSAEETTPKSLTQILKPLNEEQMKRVIDTAFDYFSYLSQSQSENDVSVMLQQRKAFVDVRFDLPPGNSRFKPLTPAPPDTAQDTTLLQVSMIYNNYPGTGVGVRFRANYYDLLTINPARIPFSELSTFDIRLNIFEGAKRNLAELTALRITNLNAANTGLPGDNKMAWKFAGGYRDLSVNNDNGALYIDGLLGKSYSPAFDIALYGGLSSTATSKNNLGGYLAVGAEFGGVFKISPHHAMSFSVGHQRYVNAPNQKRTYATWEQRFLNNQQYDVRALLRYDEEFEYSVSLSYYF